MLAQNENPSQLEQAEVFEEDNTFFRKDKFWRGADGAASIDLENGKILWLFSDTFIDPDGTGKRANSKMINNSIAIQNGYELEKSKFSFYYKGTKRKPKSFFELPGDTWFWTGHGIMVKDKLIIFLFEEIGTKEGIGFEAVGWYAAIIDNPNDNPAKWNIKYVKSPETFGVIVGSSAVLKDSSYVYAYGVKEPATHEVYLLRIDINSLVRGDLIEFDWWANNSWTKQVSEEPRSSSLFIGQTEFSVHYDKELEKYVQIQTYGMGQASIGYRLADQLQGPWSDSVIFYIPLLYHQKEFVYTANAHPELKSGGLLVTFNVNNGDFSKLVSNEEIYFPKFITLRFQNNK
jgi:hypothetical protein